MSENKDFLKGLYDKKKELESQIKAIELQIKSLNDTITIFEGKEVNKPEIPSKYPIDGTYEERIKFVLSQLGQASAYQIYEYIIKQEKIADTTKKDKVSKSVTLICSSMFRDRKISARKEGVQNIYTL